MKGALVHYKVFVDLIFPVATIIAMIIVTIYTGVKIKRGDFCNENCKHLHIL